MTAKKCTKIKCVARAEFVALLPGPIGFLTFSLPLPCTDLLC